MPEPDHPSVLPALAYALEEKSPFRPMHLEHHQNLLFCWQLRIGLKKEIEPARICNYSNWYFQNKLSHHFDIEEDFLFPFLGPANPLVKRALADHRRLRRLFSDESDPRRSLSLIEEILERHVRFEEHELFKAIRKIAPEKELSLIMKIHQEDLFSEDWGDRFWMPR